MALDRPGWVWNGQEKIVQAKSAHTVQRECVSPGRRCHRPSFSMSRYTACRIVCDTRGTRTDSGTPQRRAACERASMNVREPTHLTFTLLSLVDPVNDATNTYHHDREGDHARRRSPAHLTLPAE